MEEYPKRSNVSIQKCAFVLEIVIGIVIRTDLNGLLKTELSLFTLG